MSLPDFRGADFSDPNVKVAMGAAVDQARQEFVDALDALILVARRRCKPNDPLNLPVVAVTVKRALEGLYPDNRETQFWHVINMLAEATVRLAYPRSDLNTPTEGEQS